MVEIKQDYLTNTLTRPGIKMKKLMYIVIHGTANKGKGANAKANRNYWNNITDKKLIASAHTVIDDKCILEAIPASEISYNVGAKKYSTLGQKIIKDNAIQTPNFVCFGIEICENSDGDFEKAVTNTIEYVKAKMKEFGVPIDNIVRHTDLIYTGKICPSFYIGSEANEKAWREFKSRLVDENAQVSAPTKIDTNTVQTYTVKAGDTLGKIALNVYKDAKLYPKIKELNGLKNDTIFAGQILKV